MARQSDQPPLAGGAIMMLCILAGTALGLAFGQVTIGFLGGLGAGIAALIVVALYDRTRR